MHYHTYLWKKLQILGAVTAGIFSFGLAMYSIFFSSEAFLFFSAVGIGFLVFGAYLKGKLRWERESTGYRVYNYSGRFE